MNDGSSKTKKVFFISVISLIIILILIYIVIDSSTTNSISHEQECQYSPMLIGEVLDISFDHYVYQYPWFYYFGTDIDETKIINQFENNNSVCKVICIGECKDNTRRYLISIGDEGSSLSYLEFYAIHKPFFSKADYSYILYDGCVNVINGDEEYSILFPSVMLDYNYNELLQAGGLTITEGIKYQLNDTCNTLNTDVYNFFLNFYQKSPLYNIVSAANDQITLSFNDAILSAELNPEEKRRLDNIYTGTFTLKFDETSNKVLIIFQHT